MLSLVDKLEYIPNDIDVIGFGHVSTSHLVQPLLSNVKLNLQKVSFFTVKNLIALINNEPVRKNTIIGGDL